MAAHQLDPTSSATPQPSSSDSTNISAHTCNTTVHRATMTAAQTVGIGNGCCNSSAQSGSCQEQPARGSEDIGKVSALDGCNTLGSNPGSWSVCCRDAQPMASNCLNSADTNKQADAHPIASSLVTSSQVSRQAAGYVAANGPTKSSREDCMAQDEAEMADAQPSSAWQGDSRAVREGVSSPSSMAAAGLVWDLPEGVDAEDCLWLWLGDDDAPALTQLLMTHSRCTSSPCMWPLQHAVVSIALAVILEKLQCFSFIMETTLVHYHAIHTWWRFALAIVFFCMQLLHAT